MSNYNPNQLSSNALGGIIGLLMRNPRLLMAVVVMGIGVIGYFSSSDLNEVTGEVQRVAISEEQEMQMGLQAAPEMAAKLGGVARDEKAAHVAQIGKHLVANSVAQKSAYARKGAFNFYLLNDAKTINAFALPGGQIFITRALYDRLENEAQLAGVLGHEIGHVIHRHSAERMAQQKLGQSVVGAVMTGAGSYEVGQAAAVATQVLTMKYGRSDELESDEWGLTTMEACGYDPSQMIRVMEILKEASGSRGSSGMFSTHPDPEARIVRIKQYLQKTYPQGIPPRLSTGERMR